MKKLISLLLALLMIVGLLSTAAFAASSGQTITAPGEYTMYAPHDGYSQYFFTPTESGTYTIKSIGAKHEPGVELYLDDDLIAKDHYSGGFFNFCLVVELEARKTYSLRLSNWGEDEDVTVEITSGRNDGGPATSTIAEGLGEYSVTAGFTEPAKLYFTAPKTGGYTFKSSSTDFMSTAELYDAFGNILVQGESFDEGKFRVFAELAEGQTYLLKAYSYSGGYDSFKVVIEEGRDDGGPASFENVTQPGRYQVTAGYDAAFISFTPQESGTYTFRSDAESYDVVTTGCYPLAMLYDGDTEIQFGCSDNGSNFCFSVELEAGKTYLLEAASGMWAYRSYYIIIERGISEVGSTLSQGNLAIVCSVAGVALGFLAAMFIFKKRPAAANTEK